MVLCVGAHVCMFVLVDVCVCLDMCVCECGGGAEVDTGCLPQHLFGLFYSWK